MATTYDADNVPSSVHIGGKSGAARKSRIEHDLLLALAYEGEMTMYDLTKYDTKRHKIREGSKIRYYPSVLRAMVRLRKSGLVKVSGHGTGKKGARTVLYDLTLAGLASVLPNVAISSLNTVVENHHDLLPRVFGLWPLLVQEKVDDLARERLIESLKRSDSAEDVGRLFWDPRAIQCSNDARWLNAMKGNSQLHVTTDLAIRQAIENSLREWNDYLDLLGLAGYKAIGEWTLQELDDIIKWTPGLIVDALKDREERDRRQD